jgi:hypothetical protein
VVVVKDFPKTFEGQTIDATSDPEGPKNIERGIVEEDIIKTTVEAGVVKVVPKVKAAADTVGPGTLVVKEHWCTPEAENQDPKGHILQHHNYQALVGVG